MRTYFIAFHLGYSIWSQETNDTNTDETPNNSSWCEVLQLNQGLPRANLAGGQRGTAAGTWNHVH